jgi:trigger factor
VKLVEEPVSKEALFADDDDDTTGEKPADEAEAKAEAKAD